MGRHKKYITEEEQLIARRKRQMEYYLRNKDKINQKKKEQYIHFKFNNVNDL